MILHLIGDHEAIISIRIDNKVSRTSDLKRDSNVPFIASVPQKKGLARIESERTRVEAPLSEQRMFSFSVEQK